MFCSSLLPFVLQRVYVYLSFLAHLTQRVMCAIGIRRPSVNISIFFERTTEANVTKRGRNVHLHGLTKCCYFRCDRLSNMAARGHKSLWLAEMFYDLLLRYYMEPLEDGIENFHEWSLQAANQVLLLFGPIENPRWPKAGDII
jgi:hypothetical protein